MHHKPPSGHPHTSKTEKNSRICSYRQIISQLKRLSEKSEST